MLDDATSKKARFRVNGPWFSTPVWYVYEVKRGFYGDLYKETYPTRAGARAAAKKMTKNGRRPTTASPSAV